jgi:LmbE family N-acetylglucosaminyl deacetylase
MLSLPFGSTMRRVLCLGAHCDDVEIGCGGLLWSLARANPQLRFDVVVFASDAPRASETRVAIKALLGESLDNLIVHACRDGFFPAEWSTIKGLFETLKSLPAPDVVLTHHEADRHQDHRVVSELTWNTFRNHLVIEYEIPKFDGDFGRPNLYVPLTAQAVEQKSSILLSSFPSQRNKRWFTAELFSAVLRLRGMECNAESGYAEAFYLRKMVVAC